MVDCQTQQVRICELPMADDAVLELRYRVRELNVVRPKLMGRVFLR